MRNVRLDPFTPDRHQRRLRLVLTKALVGRDLDLAAQCDDVRRRGPRIGELRDAGAAIEIGHGGSVIDAEL
jgi:hypothetical protein